jgi:hypothetical protein
MIVTAAAGTNLRPDRSFHRRLLRLPSTVRCTMRILLAAVILVLSLAVACAEDTAARDAAVLSACIGAVVPEIEETIPGALTRNRIFILPVDEKHAMAMLRSQLPDDGHWDIRILMLDSIIRRIGTGWTPPPAVEISGRVVQRRRPPSGEFGYEELNFSFWPPGYSPAGDDAMVHALFGPTAHGATATCALRFDDGTWQVVKHRVRFYA